MADALRLRLKARLRPVGVRKRLGEKGSASLRHGAPLWLQHVKAMPIVQIRVPRATPRFSEVRKIVLAKKVENQGQYPHYELSKLTRVDAK